MKSGFEFKIITSVLRLKLAKHRDVYKPEAVR